MGTRITKTMVAFWITLLMLAVLIPNVQATNVNDVKQPDKKIEDKITGTEDLAAESENVEVTFTDFSNAKITINRVVEEDNYYLKIENVNFNFEEHQYMAFLTVGNEEPNFELDDTGFKAENMEDYDYINSNNQDITGFANEKLLYAGDLYLTIVEYNFEDKLLDLVPMKDRYKVVLNKKKITRPEQRKLTQRIRTSLFEDATNIINMETLSSKEDELKYNLKIGRVTDNEILKAIRDQKSNSLVDLLNYAKKSSAVYEATVQGSESKGITRNFTIIDDAYYFVYVSLDTENGKYYPIEDIMLTQGVVSADLTIYYLANYLDPDFVWKIEENPSKPNNNIEIGSNKVNNANKPTNVTGNLDNTKADGKLPQTGNLTATTVVILTTILIIGAVAYRKTRKYDEIK